jgi:YD repeat-containing protein
VLDTNIYLAPGEYTILVGSDHGRWYCDYETFYEWYADVTFAQPNTFSTLAPESACLVGYSDPFVGHPINAKSGNLTHQETDMVVNALGLPLVFERSYNGLDFSIGPQGPGWTHSYDMHLELNLDDNISVTFDDVVFVAPHGFRLNFSYHPGTGTFTAEPGIRATLVRNPDNTFTLTRGDQLAYHFDAGGRLVSLADRQGRITTLSYTGDLLTAITAPDGRALTLTYEYDPVHDKTLLVSVTDPAGHSVTYTYIFLDWDRYDPTKDMPILHTVTHLSDRVVTYDYSFDRFLETTSDGQGIVATNEYGELGRTTSQALPLDGGVTLVYSYTHTLVEDARGFTTTYTYTAGLLTSVEDPLQNTTTLTYDEDYNIASVTDPLDHATGFAWDGAT